jgi:hypothetical protein
MEGEIRSLLRKWERADGDDEVESLAARTAAFLSRVHDVRPEVLQSLDRLLSCDFSGRGEAIYEIVGYLRKLLNLERAGMPQPDEKR